MKNLKNVLTMPSTNIHERDGRLFINVQQDTVHVPGVGNLTAHQVVMALKALTTPVFQAGDVVRYKDDDSGLMLLVAGYDVAAAMRSRYASTMGANHLVLVSLRDGVCYSAPPAQLSLVRTNV